MDFVTKITRLYQYAKKTFVAASSAVVVTTAALNDGALSQQEIAAVAAAWLAVVGVFYATNSRSL